LFPANGQSKPRLHWNKERGLKSKNNEPKMLASKGMHHALMDVFIRGRDRDVLSLSLGIMSTI